MKISKQKANYGWYHVEMMLSHIIIGIIGIVLLIFGLIYEGILHYILLIGGIIVILVFLWPGLGIFFINVYTNLGKSHPIASPEIINSTEKPQILDIGCGSGRAAISLAKQLKKEGKVYGIDIFNNAIKGNSLEKVRENALLERIEQKTDFQYGSATQIPFGNKTFDIINISYVMHEISDKPKALSEIKRVLKPNGKLYLTEFHRNSFGAVLMNGFHNLLFKNHNYWISLLENNSFNDIEYHKKGAIGTFIAGY